MVIVNYKSKRQLKKDIGKLLKWFGGRHIVQNGEPFFVRNYDDTFRATVTLTDGKIMEVR